MLCRMPKHMEPGRLKPDPGKPYNICSETFFMGSCWEYMLSCMSLDFLRSEHSPAAFARHPATKHNEMATSLEIMWIW